MFFDILEIFLTICLVIYHQCDMIIVKQRRDCDET